jgi:hypothetical protein
LSPEKERTLTLTRQHFQLIANVVSQVEDAHQREIIALNFMKELQKTNGNFKTALFLKACGV